MAVSYQLAIYTTAGVLLASVLYFFYLRSSYWKRRGVKSFGNIFWGIAKEFVTGRAHYGDCLKKHYNEWKQLRYTGSFKFFRPVLIVHDIEIIKEVFRDVSRFGGRGTYYDADSDPLSAHLLSMEGSDWKSMRTKLSPVFSSGKIKNMFSTILDSISNLDKYMSKQLAEEKSAVIDSRELMARYATDVILSVAFGIEQNCLENPDAEFRKYGKEVLDPSFDLIARKMILFNMHWICKIFRVKCAPPNAHKFFMKAIAEVVAYRERSNITRKDFLDLMIRLKNYGTVKDGEIIENKSEGNFITDNQIAAQAFLFFLAGFETTSSTLSYALFEIAKHPEIQQKLHEECDAAMKACNGEITYEIVNSSLNYLEMVVKESQRLYPTAPMLFRCTLEECELPHTNLKLDKGQVIHIPIRALQHDPDFFPDPEKFDPERFSVENKSSVPAFAFLPFGEGPRICIGMRYAMVQVKATLMTLLSRFHFELAEGTSTTLRFDPRNFIPVSVHPVNLKITPREKI